MKVQSIINTTARKEYQIDEFNIGSVSMDWKNGYGLTKKIYLEFFKPIYDFKIGDEIEVIDEIGGTFSCLIEEISHRGDFNFFFGKHNLQRVYTEVILLTEYAK